MCYATMCNAPDFPDLTYISLQTNETVKPCFIFAKDGSDLISLKHFNAGTTDTDSMEGWLFTQLNYSC